MRLRSITGTVGLAASGGAKTVRMVAAVIY